MHQIKYLSLIALLLPVMSLAQEDYIVFHSGDTLYGMYKKVQGDYTTLKTTNGKREIANAEIKELHVNGRKYVIFKDPCSGFTERYVVWYEGSISLLFNRDNDHVLCEDMARIDGKVYPLDAPYLSDAVWEMLSQCPAFKARYQSLYEEGKKKILIVNKSVYAQWEQMTRFYNSNCGTE